MSIKALEFCDSHNMIAFLKKSKQATGFHEVIDFLKNSNVHYALTVNPTIYIVHITAFWNTAQLDVKNGERRIKATVDGQEVIITETIIRQHLHLEDASGITSLSSDALFSIYKDMGYEGSLSKFTFQKALLSPAWKLLVHVLQQCVSSKKGTWNEFNKSIATALACLASGQVFNFSSMIFEGMHWNLTNQASKFLMYPRFLQLIFNGELKELTVDDQIYVSPSHTAKVFANMRRQGKGFSGKLTPLFPNMLVVDAGEGPSSPLGSQPTPDQPDQAATVKSKSATKTRKVQFVKTSSLINPSFSKPLTVYRRRQKGVPSTPVPKSQPITPEAKTELLSTKTLGTPEPLPKLKKVVLKEVGDHVGRAHPTVVAPSVAQDRVNITKTQTTATLSDDDSFELLLQGGPRCQETTWGEGFAYARHESPSKNTPKDPPTVGTQQGSGEGRYDYTTNELMDTCLNLQNQLNDQAKEIEKLKKMVMRMKKEGFSIPKGHFVETKDKKVGTSSDSEPAAVKGEKAYDVSATELKDRMLMDMFGENWENLFVEGKVEEMAEMEEVYDVIEKILFDMGIVELDWDSMFEEYEEEIVVEKVKETEVENAQKDVDEEDVEEIDTENVQVPVTTGPVETITTAPLETEAIKAAKIISEIVKEVEQELRDENEEVEGEYKATEEEITAAAAMLKVKEREEKKLKKKRKAQLKYDAEIARELESTLQKQVDPTVQAQLDDDAAYAKQVERELAEEEERDARDAIELSKRRLSKIQRAKDDKDKFVRYLKTKGYSGKQLGPMKLNNVLSLYEEEKKKEKEKEEKRKYEHERELKIANDRGARVIHTVGLEKEKEEMEPKKLKRKRSEPVTTGATVSTAQVTTATAAPVETSTRNQKRVKTIGHKKKPRVLEQEEDSESEEQQQDQSSKGGPSEQQAEEEQEDLTQWIIHNEVVYSNPLQVKYPIIDWLSVDRINRSHFKVIRQDQSEKLYKSFFMIFKSMDRDDLIKMYEIGEKKFGNRTGAEPFNPNYLLLDLFKNMFEPEKMVEKELVRKTGVVDWKHHENCGVYSVHKTDGLVDFYLVEKEYDHDPWLLQALKSVKLRANVKSEEAKNLIRKINRQIKEKEVEEKKKMEEFRRRTEELKREGLLKAPK